MRWSCVALVVVGCAFLTGCYERQLPTDELEELFTDSKVGGHHLLDGYAFARHYKDDGTFEQYEGPDATGTWTIEPSEFCITWNRPHPKSGQSYCRRILTDDEGEYWKEGEKRNGDTVDIVRYSFITSADGVDRRRIPSSGTRWKRWMGTWRGFVLGVFGAIFLFLILHKLFKGKDDPDSTRNRIRRRYFRLRVGQFSYRFSEIEALDDTQLLDFISQCVAVDARVEFYWAVDLLLRRSPNTQVGIASLWSRLKVYPDDVARRSLLVVMRLFGDSKSNIEAVQGDTRFSFLMGRVHQDTAMVFQRASEWRFDDHKKQALEYFDHARSQESTPPPELAARAAPYRENPYEVSNQVNYAVFVGAAYEAMMYANYIAPVVSSSSSSSYSGGG